MKPSITTLYPRARKMSRNTAVKFTFLTRISTFPFIHTVLQNKNMDFGLWRAFSCPHPSSPVFAHLHASSPVLACPRLSSPAFAYLHLPSLVFSCFHLPPLSLPPFSCHDNRLIASCLSIVAALCPHLLCILSTISEKGTM